MIFSTKEINSSWERMESQTSMLWGFRRFQWAVFNSFKCFLKVVVPKESPLKTLPTVSPPGPMPSCKYHLKMAKKVLEKFILSIWLVMKEVLTTWTWKNKKWEKVPSITWKQRKIKSDTTRKGKAKKKEIHISKNWWRSRI